MSNYLIVKDTQDSKGVIVDLHVFTTETQALKELAKYNTTTDVTYRIQKLIKQLTDIEKYHLNRTHATVVLQKSLDYMLGEVTFNDTGEVSDVTVYKDTNCAKLQHYFEDVTLKNKESNFKYQGVERAFFIFYINEEFSKYELIVNHPEVESEYNEFLNKLDIALKYYTAQADKIKLAKYTQNDETVVDVTLGFLLDEVHLTSSLFRCTKFQLIRNLINEPEDLKDVGVYSKQLKTFVSVNNYLDYLALSAKQGDYLEKLGGKQLERFNHEQDTLYHKLYKAYKKGLLSSIQPTGLTNIHNKIDKNTTTKEVLVSGCVARQQF